MAVKVIPPTTIRSYISGKHSLNLDIGDGTGYDWHFMNYWLDGSEPIKLYGEGHPYDTNPIYGYYGVADRYRLLRELGVNVDKVYVANHHRAILDMVYESLMMYEQIGYAKGCVEDYFYEEHQAKELFSNLVLMLDFLDEDKGGILSEWLSREFRPFYKSWRSGAV